MKSEIRDLMTTSVNKFSGKLLLCGTCVKDIDPEKFKELSGGRSVFVFCPELNHSSLLGYKLTTILRTSTVEDIWTFTKDGSPHCEQILTTLQEVAENVNFDKSKLRYFVTKKGKFLEIADSTIRKSRNIMEIEKMMRFNKLYKVVEILTDKDGCPNDRKESFETIMEHFKEELGELEAGLEKKNWKNVQEELGDILFNIFLFAKVSQNNKQFDIFELFDKTADKFISKHPDVFRGKVIK